MQILQQILQRAIQSQCALIEISAMQELCVWDPNGQSTWSDFGMFSEQDVMTLLKTLFPKGIGEKPAKGQIEIPSYGNLQTIGSVGPKPRLLIFFPSGQDMFTTAWNDMSAPVENDESSLQEDTPNLATEMNAASIPSSIPFMQTPPPPPPAAPIAVTSEAMTPPQPKSDATSLPLASIFGMSKPKPPAAVPSPTPDAAPVKIEAPVTNPEPVNIGEIFGIGKTKAKKVEKTPAPTTTMPEPAPLAVAAVVPVAMEAAPIEVAKPVEVSAPIMSEPVQVAPIVHAQVSHAAHTSSPKVDKLLRMMLDRRASDLHITANEPIALRIDGDIVPVPEHRMSDEDVGHLLKSMSPDFNWRQFEEDNDTDFAYELKDTARFRVNLFRDHHGRGAVMRHIPNKIPSFESLGMPDVLRKFCMLSKGLVVVTGPTGSGKTTTLAAMIDLINQSRKEHILTLEDPIEFVHPAKNCLIRQREIYRHTKSFSRALKAALREDPDIILVGELRDLETTSLAIEVAETGHLVFGTLHTTTAISTVDRIIDQFPTDRQEQIRTMLAESLRGVVSQTLLKKEGGGRCAAQEVLVVNQAVSALIREGKNHMIASHMQSQKADGNMLLNEALLNLVAKKVVHPKDAWLKAVDKANLIERYRQAGIDLSWYQTIYAA